MTIITSLNVHPTQILSLTTPVKTISNPGGRDVLIFDGEDIKDYILLDLPGTNLPVPKVGTTKPGLETIQVGEVDIPVQVSSGTQIENLPEPKEGVIYMTSYPTAKAASEMGRKDFINAGPMVFAAYDAETGRGTVILGCLGVNRFA